ncbi:MAG: flagellar basal body-associated FliL family protein [Pseudomonadales bacterium]
MKKIIIIVASVLGLVIVSVGMSVFLANYIVDSKLSEMANAAEEENAEEMVEVKAPPIYLPLDPFVVNFVQNGALRYLQITLELMSRNSEIIETVKLNTPEIRNSLILVLSGHTYADLASRKGKELIREQVQYEINRIIEVEEGIESVYLTCFVMQ